MKVTFKKAIVFLALSLIYLLAYPQAIPVVITDAGGGNYQMLRGGEPYYIKGVAGGGVERMDELIARGGNSMRTWGVDGTTMTLLDEAQSRGLTVMLGLWIGRERDGFDYNDTAAIANQLNTFRGIVNMYKDHPALLAWGIGNEVDMAYTNLNVWNAVNDLSKMIHDLDGNHPTLTVTAGISTSKANTIAERAPDLDMLGINAYAGITGVYSVITGSNFTKSYIITEWGVNGPWEVQKTTWDAPLEQNSSLKAASFKSRYEQYISAYPGKCLGSYAFLWGFKTEGTKTWFGLFVNSETTEMIDVLQYKWTGEWPVDQAPRISSMTINNTAPENSLVILFSDNNEVIFEANDPEGDSLTYEFLILPESGSEGVLPIPGAAFDAIPGIIKEQTGNKAILKFNDSHNLKKLRLYAFVRDGKGHIGTASFPFSTEIIDLKLREWTFPAVQDAFVRDGIYQNTPYGSNDEKKLYVKRHSGTDLSREIYLQFDLTDAPRYFGTAWLELYGDAPLDCKVQLFSAGTVVWNEKTITWANKPAAVSGNLTRSDISTSQKWYHWDLTRFVSGQFAAGNRMLNLILKGYQEYDGEPALFNSREADANPPGMFFSTASITGIQETFPSEFMVYPNPANGEITIRFPASSPDRSVLRLTALNGQTIRILEVPPGTESSALNITFLEPGMYILWYESLDGLPISITKLVKQ